MNQLHFTHIAKSTLEQKPIQLANILTIPKFRGWKYGYKGTFPLFLTTSHNFLFLLTVGRSFRLVVFLCIFYHFCYWHFHFSCWSTISLCSLYIWNFGLDSPQIITSKEPKGRLGHSPIFGPCCKNIPENFYSIFKHLIRILTYHIFSTKLQTTHLKFENL